MDVKSAAREINSFVSMQTILNLYGYHPKHGFMPCPFHRESQASMKIYPGGRGWYCFGCHKGGTPIDFVMEHEGCNFKTAVMAIDGSLGLGLLEAQDPLKVERRRAEEKKIEKITDAFTELCRLNKELINLDLQTMTKRSMELYSIPKKDRSADEWTEIHYLDDTMQYLEYKLDRFDDFRREVAEWKLTKLRDLTKKARSAC